MIKLQIEPIHKNSPKQTSINFYFELYLNRDSYPTEEEQFEVYKNVLEKPLSVDSGNVSDHKIAEFSIILFGLTDKGFLLFPAHAGEVFVPAADAHLQRRIIFGMYQCFF